MLIKDYNPVVIEEYYDITLNGKHLGRVNELDNKLKSLILEAAKIPNTQIFVTRTERNLYGKVSEIYYSNCGMDIDEFIVYLKPQYRDAVILVKK